MQIVINYIVFKKTIIFNIIYFELVNKVGNIFGLIYITTYINNNNKIIKEINI